MTKRHGFMVAATGAITTFLSTSSVALGAGGPQPGAVTQSTVSLPDGPGSIRGLADDASIELFSAQVRYSIPIDVPSAHGVAPQLALGYAGELGNGPVGVGWTLATPRIERSTRLGVPAFDATDELVLVGTPASGTLVYAGDGSYRLEGAPMSVRVVVEDDGFRMWDSDGTQYVFGVATSSRRGGVRGTQAWFVDGVVGTNGAAIKYAYAPDRGEVYLDRVTWGPDDAYQVVLDYGDRPDVTRSFREGHERVVGRRVQSVTVSAFGARLRAYQLAYDDSLSLSRLRQVRQVGRDDSASLPALTFSYAAPVAQIEPVQLEGVGTWRIGERGISLADVDGDGAADLLRVASDEHSFRKNYGGRFGDIEPMVAPEGLDLATARLADMDGDSVADLVYRAAGRWFVQRFEGEGWQAVGAWSGTDDVPLFDPSAVWIDIDGDRLIDTVQWNEAGLLIRLGEVGGLGDVVLPQPPLIGGALTPGEVRFADVNGDGLPDAIETTSTFLRVYYGHGNGYYGDGELFSYPASAGAVDVSEIELVDLNRDGLLDLVTTAGSYVRWYRGEVSGDNDGPRRQAFSETAIEVGTPASAEADVYIADANGNGSRDIVWSDDTGLWLLDLAGSTTAGMLVEIDNGMGKVMDIDYGSSAVLAAAAHEAGNPWRSTLPMSIPVPVRKRVFPVGKPEVQSDGTIDDSEASVWRYGVRDGTWDSDEQRFGGFLEGSERAVLDDGAGDRVTTTRFNPGRGITRVLRGKPMAVAITDGDGVLQQKTLNSWRAQLVEGMPAGQLRLRRPVMTRQRVSQYEGVPSRIRTDVRYDYDTLGRRTAEHNAGRTDRGDDEVERTWRYAHNDVTWVRERVCEETVHDSDGSLVRHSRTFYGAAGQDLALCQVERGWARRKADLLVRADDTQAWITRELTEHDSLGNPVITLRDGVTRTVEYDVHGLYPIAESIDAGGDDRLVWRTTWDTVLGQPLTHVSADGATTTMTYDAVGRPLSIAKGAADAAPHQLFEYQWEGPYPRTWQRVFDGPLDAVPAWTGDWATTGPWRESVTVADGRGDTVYSATRLDADRWIVSGWLERDRRARVVFVGEPTYAPQAISDERPAGMVGQAIEYDAFDRVKVETLADGTERRQTFSAFASDSTVTGLAVERRQFDGQGRIARTERTIGDVVQVVEADYDAEDRIRAMRLQDDTLTHAFEYDTLGRLVRAFDPDIGERRFTYYDDRGGALLRTATNGESQTVHYEYDDAARLVSASDRDGHTFAFRYDRARAGTNLEYTASRLAWIDEPTGKVDIGYDRFGREAQRWRTIDDGVHPASSSRETTHYTASGLVHRVDFHDGVEIERRYDRAARLIGIGELWSVIEQDASGRVLRESFGNGVQQHYERDVRGRTTAARVTQAGALAPIYAVDASYEPWGSLASIEDTDSVGLDHSSAFSYDAASRLTAATIGASVHGADGAYGFGYRYDALQNLVERTMTGPTQLGVQTGHYRYGEADAAGHSRGPRQLTSIAPTAGGGAAPEHTMDYDGAGRQIRQDQRTMAFNAFDQLVRVDVPGVGAVSHAYGFNGARVQTVDASGRVQRWFTPNTSERDGVREHTIYAGDRLIARLRAAESTSSAAAGAIAPGRAGLWIVVVCAALAGLAMMLWSVVGGLRRSRWQAATASVALATLVTASCGTAGHGSWARSVTTVSETLYYHATLSAGPSVMTREDGTIFAERRYEPFGAAIDSYRDTAAGGSSIEGVDYRRDPHNVLNKRSDADTGWSYHGARWMAPETTRWLTPDPPVKAPDAKYLAEPWGLHPYQYVRNNPVQFWDPDGRDGAANPSSMPQRRGSRAGWARIGALAVQGGFGATSQSAGPGIGDGISVIGEAYGFASDGIGGALPSTPVGTGLAAAGLAMGVASIYMMIGETLGGSRLAGKAIAQANGHQVGFAYGVGAALAVLPEDATANAFGQFGTESNFYRHGYRQGVNDGLASGYRTLTSLTRAQRAEIRNVVLQRLRDNGASMEWLKSLNREELAEQYGATFAEVAAETTRK